MEKLEGDLRKMAEILNFSVEDVKGHYEVKKPNGQPGTVYVGSATVYMKDRTNRFGGRGGYLNVYFESSLVIDGDQVLTDDERLAIRDLGYVVSNDAKSLK